MHSRIYEEFEEILSNYELNGRILEIGAKPDETALLASTLFENSDNKVGVNLEGGSYNDFEVKESNANDLEFENDTFDVIVCNATLEHDKFFWKTLSEINRVANEGCLIIIGVPGYSRKKEIKTGFHRITNFLSPLISKASFSEEELNEGINYENDLFNLIRRGFLKLERILRDLPGYSAALTYEVHSAPSDYYRFSEDAVEKLFLSECHEKKINEVMTPPRIIGKGIYTEKDLG